MAWKERWTEEADETFWQLSPKMRGWLQDALDQHVRGRILPAELPDDPTKRAIVAPPYIIVVVIEGDELVVLDIRRKHW